MINCSMYPAVRVDPPFHVLASMRTLNAYLELRENLLNGNHFMLSSLKPQTYTRPLPENEASSSQIFFLFPPSLPHRYTIPARAVRQINLSALSNLRPIDSCSGQVKISYFRLLSPFNSLIPFNLTEFKLFPAGESPLPVRTEFDSPHRFRC